MNLPIEYVHYLESGGILEGFTDDEPGYIALWPLADVTQRNIDYNVCEYAPGYLGFGSDGGGELLAFDEVGCVYKLPMIGMAPRHAVKIAKSWGELAHRIGARTTELLVPEAQPNNSLDQSGGSL